MIQWNYRSLSTQKLINRTYINMALQKQKCGKYWLGPG